MDGSSEQHFELLNPGSSDFLIGEGSGDHALFPCLHLLHSFLHRVLLQFSTSMLPYPLSKFNFIQIKTDNKNKKMTALTFTINLLTRTVRSCPMRWIRIIACSSTAGFHQGSYIFNVAKLISRRGKDVDYKKGKNQQKKRWKNVPLGIHWRLLLDLSRHHRLSVTLAIPEMGKRFS